MVADVQPPLGRKPPQQRERTVSCEVPAVWPLFLPPGQHTRTARHSQRTSTSVRSTKMQIKGGGQRFRVSPFVLHRDAAPV